MKLEPYVRLTFGGTLGTGASGVERWSNSLAIGAVGSQGDIIPLPSTTELDGIVAALSSWHAAAATMTSNQAKLDTVKVASIGADGHYNGDAVVRAVAPVSGGQAGFFHAPQVARVVTLHSGQRGKSKRGRIFLPMPTAALGNDLLVPAGDADGVATRTAQMIGEINTALTTAGHRVVIHSKTVIGNSAVTGVTCGRVLDTVRSRRRSLKEFYGTDSNVLS